MANQLCNRLQWKPQQEATVSLATLAANVAIGGVPFQSPRAWRFFEAADVIARHFFCAPQTKHGWKVEMSSEIVRIFSKSNKIIHTESEKHPCDNLSHSSHSHSFVDFYFNFCFYVFQMKLPDRTSRLPVAQGLPKRATLCSTVFKKKTHKACLPFDR